MSNDLERVRRQIEEMHHFIQDWVSGKAPEDDAIEKKLLNRFAGGFMGIMPGGVGFELGPFREYMRTVHGSNPPFRIQIRNVKVRHRVGDVVVATYEEWEKAAKDSNPSNNARQSTMVLRDKGDDFEVLHVHETWLPKDRMEADAYDF